MDHLARLPALVTSILGVTALAAVIAPAPASAANIPEIIVNYQDLDLGRPADLELLYRRLQAAADTVCVPVASYDLVRAAAHQRCVQTVLEHSVQQVRSPALLALHRANAASHHHGAVRS